MSGKAKIKKLNIIRIYQRRYQYIKGQRVSLPTTLSGVFPTADSPPRISSVDEKSQSMDTGEGRDVLYLSAGPSPTSEDTSALYWTYICLILVLPSGLPRCCPDDFYPELPWSLPSLILVLPSGLPGLGSALMSSVGFTDKLSKSQLWISTPTLMSIIVCWEM